MSLPKVTLLDKYTKDSGRIYLTGTQALVRSLMVQRRRDEAAGLNTAGFISGYRGSPMTVMDQELWRAEQLLEQHHIKFWPAVNEHMAATAIWGSQQTHFNNDANYDGVFAAWYGKGPGLDQSLDAMRQANYWGTSEHGGALVMSGDDPTMTSTVDAYHSELLFEDLLMPVLYPADIQDVFDLAIYGIALSRFCGAWVGYKLLPETVETAASIHADHEHIKVILPKFEFPEDGVNSRAGDMWFNQEGRLRKYKLPAAIAFARANKLNRLSHDSSKARFGIAAMGKTWRNTLQALTDLGIDDAMLETLGIRILKVAMPYPVDRETYREFAEGLDDILVIEDKREQIENALRDVCYRMPENQRPRIVGRRDENDALLVDDVGDLNADKIARVLAARLQHIHNSERMQARINFLDKQLTTTSQRETLNLVRLPYFCSGCPHNTSTKLPDGSVGYGGVGCHFMAYWMDRGVGYATQMGGEGVPWVGQAPFVKTKHIFQQIGDGTYYHSGIGAIRSSVAAKTNITYKILFNDAVAMTGGQPVDGPITVPKIAQQMRAEGIERIAVVSDEPEKYTDRSIFPSGTSFNHRRDLDLIQRELREIEGTTIMIYDQTCAAEKRRRRKRGTFPDPAKRLFINDRVCEGCGDCSKKSNCVSVLPFDTEFGRKRKIDQSSCNKDYSCNDGFCPSFVTVLGGELRKGKGLENTPWTLEELPEPAPKSIEPGQSFAIMIGGVGGTGVVTIGALLGMAAHLDGKGVSVVDQMGFAQKGGAVYTHIRIANQTEDIDAARINAGAANLILGCDMLVAGGDQVLDMIDENKTHAVINTHKTITGDFTRDPDLEYPSDTLETRLRAATADDKIDFLAASHIATKLLGDSIGSNLFLVGFAWQKGLIPLSNAAILEAVRLNGVKVEWNQQAFEWGRRAANDLKAVTNLIDGSSEPTPLAKSLDQIIEHRSAELVKYQNSAYAKRYQELVATIRQAEKNTGDKTRLSEAVARYAHKLMAYKDEYEVARLHSDPAFKQKLDEQFEGNYKLQFNLSPPAIAPKDKVTGLPRKMTFGSWMMPAFGLLAKMKVLRGTAFDPFGRTAERRTERKLIEDYFDTVEQLGKKLNSLNYSLATEIASLPEQIRGYGHVKEANIDKYQQDLESLLERYQKVIPLQQSA